MVLFNRSNMCDFMIYKASLVSKLFWVGDKTALRQPQKEKKRHLLLQLCNTNIGQERAQ